MVSIAAKTDWPAETLRRWMRQAEPDNGLRPGPTSAEQARIRELEGRMIGRPLQRLTERRAARHLRAHAVRADPDESQRIMSKADTLPPREEYGARH